jgi:ATP-dependent helicase/DNAse subunit B
MIKVSYFRSSSLGNWEFCQQQYFLNYILGLPRTAGQKAEKGTIVHKILEGLAIVKLACQQTSGDKVFIKDDVFGAMTLDRKDLMSPETVDIFTQIAYEYYVSKSTFPYVKLDLTHIKKWTNEALTYQNGLYDPRRRRIEHPEKSFNFMIKKPWAKFNYDGNEGYLGIKGTIDLITRIDDNTLEIIDWKTGQRKNWATGNKKEYEDLCKDDQLMLYYYAARHLFPGQDIMFTIFFLRDGGPFSICFDEHHLKATEDLLKKKFNDIRNSKLPKMVSSTQNDFRCTKLCDYYKETYGDSDKNICRFIHDETKKHGVKHVQDLYTLPGFSPDHYQSPGE